MSGSTELTVLLCKRKDEKRKEKEYKSTNYKYPIILFNRKKHFYVFLDSFLRFFFLLQRYCLSCISFFISNQNQNNILAALPKTIRSIDQKMALAILKKPCSKCNKGMSILTCDGCQQSFCAKHITDHREELSIQMDNIGQEYDLLRRDLIRDDAESSPLLNRINLWEKESMAKIQQIAQQARDDLVQCLDRNKNQIKDVFNKLADEFQSCRQSGDYTEIDFKLWIEQLTELRKALEKTAGIDLIDNDKTLTPIYMIKIKEKTDVHFSRVSAQALDHTILTTERSNVPVTEIFNRFIGDATLSDRSLVATHSGDQRSTMVHIAHPYSTGIHQIRFHIKQKSSKYLFFGIINSLEKMTRTVFNSPSLYGWMAPDVRVVKSRKLLSANLKEKFNEDDEVSLTLNCNVQQIILEHQESNTIDRLPIDLRVCPLPWRIVVAFFSRNDSVGIIH